MEKSRKALKTITISEVWYPECGDISSDKPFFLVDVKVGDDSTGGSFDNLPEAEEYASDVAKRPLKPWDINNSILGMR